MPRRYQRPFADTSLAGRLSEVCQLPCVHSDVHPLRSETKEAAQRGGLSKLIGKENRRI